MGETKKFFAMGEGTPSKKLSKKETDALFKEKADQFLASVNAKVSDVVPLVKDFALKPVAGTKNKVFVQPAYKEEVKSANGLVLEFADPNMLKPYGTVIAVTEQDEDGKTPTVKVGDIVHFDNNFYLKEFEGIKFNVMKEGNIYGKL